jgi:hypothetical protein
VRDGGGAERDLLQGGGLHGEGGQGKGHYHHYHIHYYVYYQILEPYRNRNFFTVVIAGSWEHTLNLFKISNSWSHIPQKSQKQLTNLRNLLPYLIL